MIVCKYTEYAYYNVSAFFLTVLLHCQGFWCGGRVFRVPRRPRRSRHSVLQQTFYQKTDPWITSSNSTYIFSRIKHSRQYQDQDRSSVKMHTTTINTATPPRNRQYLITSIYRIPKPTPNFEPSRHSTRGSWHRSTSVPSPWMREAPRSQGPT